MYIRSRIFPHWQDAGHFTLTLLLIPFFYYFEVFIVLPALYSEWTVTYSIHIILSIFLLHNITGNMLGGMLINTSIQGHQMPSNPPLKWHFCAVCECAVPPRSWHCSICNICILKRDHHCSFFGCCVGHLNHRYFFMFVFYVFISTVYGLFFNICYIYETFSWENYFAFLPFIFPLASLAWDLSLQNMYITICMINIIVVLFTGFLFVYHGNLIVTGKVTPDNKDNAKFIYDFGLKSNILNVFGSRWYLAVISPIFSSDLPTNGITWAESYKTM